MKYNENTGNAIQSIEIPTTDKEIANKEYVDNNVTDLNNTTFTGTTTVNEIKITPGATYNLNFYDRTQNIATWTGGTGWSVQVLITMVRIGYSIMGYISGETDTQSTISSIQSPVGTVPADFRPSVNMSSPISLTIGGGAGTPSIGVLTVDSSDGTITIQQSGNGTGFQDLPADTIGWPAQTFQMFTTIDP